MDFLQSSIMLTNIASAPYETPEPNRNRIEHEQMRWEGRLKRASISINIESLNTYLSGS